MKKLMAIVVSSLLLTFGLAAQPASAACSMTGTGASNDPWIIMTPADLTKVGVVEAGGCLTTYNQNQHYILGSDIALTGDFLPIKINASDPYTGSFDGNDKVISGLNVSRSGVQEVGLFSKVTGATVKDFTLTGDSVVGSSYVGAIAGNANSSLFQNIVVVMSGGVQGTQLVGGLIGAAISSSITDLVYKSGSGEVQGTDYVGGGFGQLQSTTLSNVAVGTALTTTGISGGVVGSFIPSSSTAVNQITYEGSFVGDQYVGGLIGYLWSSSTPAVIISNSAVSGRIATVSGSYSPKAFVGHVGSGIVNTQIAQNYSVASYFSAATEATSILAIDETHTISDSYFETWNAGTTITDVNVAATGITAAALAGGSNWTVAQKATYSTSTGDEDWVVDTSVNPMNAGLPMTASAYNMGFYNPPCEVGSFSATGFTPCSLAPAGSYISTSGATSAIRCPAGYFAAATGSISCTPAQPGFFVADAGSSAQQACPAGYTSEANAIACVAPASVGVTVLAPKFTGKPKINGTVAKGKSLNLIHPEAISSVAVTYTYKWHRCAKPVVAAEQLPADAGCVEISSATLGSLLVGASDAKSFLTAEVTATNSGGSASYIASSVNAKTLKYLGLTKQASVAGTAKVGKSLKVSKLRWVAAAPTKVSYQWYRCSSEAPSGSQAGADCKAISGAKSSTYRVAKADKKKYLAVKLTAVLGDSKFKTYVGVATKTL